MNTHILIPIEDIKDIIKRYRKDIDTSERSGDNITAAAFTHMIDGLETAAKLGKKISLDEKDIEENIKEVKIVVMTQQQLLETKFEDKQHLEKMEKVLKTLQALKDLI